MNWKTALLTGCVLALALPALAKEPAAPTKRAKAAPAQKKDAQQKRKATIRLNGATWHRGVDGALAANTRAAEPKRRPVFFVRMLGDLDGKT